MSKINVGVVGCGAVVDLFYISALKRMKSNIDVKYFVDTDKGRANKFAQKFTAKIATDYTSISGEVDAVIIATPHFLHYKIGKYFLQKGIHVLIEKPITSSVEELNELISIADKKSLILSAGNFRRYQDSMLWMKSFVENEPFGELKSFIAREGGKYNWPVTTNSFWEKASSGGGVLMDTGAHTIDQVVMLCGYPDTLDYTDNCLDNIETDCDLVLAYDSGTSGAVQLSRTIGLGAGILLKYEKGNVYLDLIGKRIISNKDEIYAIKYNGKGIGDLKAQDFVKLMVRQLESWCDGIKGFSKAYVSANDVLPSIRLIEKCYAKQNEK